MKLELREASQEFSRLVRAIRAGQEVVLTDRGEAIAVVKPLERRGYEKAFRTMVVDGLIRPARRRGPMKLSRFRTLKVTGRPVAETISADREERV